MSAELVPAYAQAPVLKQWNDEQVEMATRSFARDCTYDELEVFAQVCHRKGLDPWLGEIVAVKRGGKMIVQETVEGLRTIAERSGLYGGYSGPWWCGPDEIWREVWLATTPPAAARMFVRRKDWTDPVPGLATWASNAQFDRQGKLYDVWAARPDEMLAKCAEVRALRRAFPKEFARAGISVRELTDAQIVAVEARAAGLTDDDRHELAAQVSGGRTDSSRELTDPERLEARREVAKRRPPDKTEKTDGAWGDWFTDHGWSTKQEHDEYRADMIGRLKAASAKRQSAFKAWREANKVPAFSEAHTKEQAGLVASNIVDILGPPPPVDEPEDAEIIPDPPASPLSVIDELYAKVEGRMAALTEQERAAMCTDLEPAGIDPTKHISELKQDQVHVIDAWLDQLEEPL